MFEKFTQKAIDVVQSAQNYALEFKHDRVLSQHLLLGLVFHSKGVQAKILNFDKINFGELTVEVQNSFNVNHNKDNNNVLFSSEARLILKRAVELSEELKSQSVMQQHIALSILLDKDCGAYKILKKFNIDEEKIIPNLKRILDKSKKYKSLHPENLIVGTELTNVNDFFKETVIAEILSTAKAKATTSDYEIVGSEQILQSILDNNDSKIVEILNKYNVNINVFNEKLHNFKNRQAEYENSEKQIIFTPNAFNALLASIDYAKESGSVSIQPEHIVMGILKTKQGIAYKILSELLPHSVDFEDVIMKKINDKIPETFAILRLAKAEAENLDITTIGTEMILLGILAYGNGVAYNVLKHLGITLKDARVEVEKLLKSQKTESNLAYSPRAKKLLEVAYETAREHKRSKIKSENLLYGITKMPDCVAMQVISILGSDVLEVRQGIKQELLGGMEL